MAGVNSSILPTNHVLFSVIDASEAQSRTISRLRRNAFQHFWSPVFLKMGEDYRKRNRKIPKFFPYRNKARLFIVPFCFTTPSIQIRSFYIYINLPKEPLRYLLSPHVTWQSNKTGTIGPYVKTLWCHIIDFIPRPQVQVAQGKCYGWLGSGWLERKRSWLERADIAECQKDRIFAPVFLKYISTISEIKMSFQF